MNDVYLGELEQIVLLAVLRAGEQAYAMPILEQIERHTDARSRVARSTPRSTGSSRRAACGHVSASRSLSGAAAPGAISA